MHNKKIISGLLRIGIAFSFLYPAIDSLFNSDTWVGFFPNWLLSISPVDVIVLATIFSVIEIFIAVGILLMPKPTLPTLTAIIVLGAIIVFNWSALDIVFRDISILIMAIALIVLHKKQHR